MRRTIILLLFAFIFNGLQAATFTVTTTNDAGSGSLREAMTFCNLTPGADLVAFNIAGPAPHTINLASSLPILSDGGTTIDGTTQPLNGSSTTGRRIIVDGSLMSSGNGIEVTGINFTLKGIRIQYIAYHGLVLNASANGYTIGGIGAGNTISGNYYAGIVVDGADNGTIKGNFIGTNDDGTAAFPNEYEGLSLTFANNTVVGGTASGEGNVISGNRYYGLLLEASTGCTVLGNMIGVDAAGTTALPNEYYGILLTDNANGNTIGNATSGGANVISGNLYHGIAIECSNNNVIKGNKIGTDASGGNAIPNEYSGINIGPTSSNFSCNAAGNVVGGIAPGEGNIIANNLYYGVNVWGTNANFNPVRGNKIYCNDYNGFTLDDGNYGQPDGNNGYAAPVISSANAVGASGTAAPNDFVDLYFDDQCTNCEPRSYITTVQANGSGNWTYSGALSGSLTAIATHSTNNNSSANSACSFISTSTLPTANFQAINTQFCGGGCTSFIDFSTGQPTSWSWSFPGGNPATSTLQNPQNICYSAPGTYAVSLTVTNNSGSDTETQQGYIVVAAQPVVDAGIDVAICEGDTTMLQGSSNGGYAWTPSTALSNATIANPLAFPTTTTTYILTGQLGNCEANDTVVVTVFPFSFTGITQVGNLLTANTSGTIFQWFLNGSPIPGANSQSYTVTVSGNYSVQVSDANGCSAVSETLELTIIAVADAMDGLGIDLAPNPSGGICNVHMSGMDAAEVQLRVVDMLGRVLLTRSETMVTNEGRCVLDVQHLPDGCYQVHLQQGDRQAVKVLVIRQ